MKIPKTLKGTRVRPTRPILEGERHMSSVEVLIPVASDLSRVLVRMREWLDHQGFEPSTFRYVHSDTGDTAVVHVAFKLDDQAVAFASTFGGRLTPLPASRP